MDENRVLGERFVGSPSTKIAKSGTMKLIYNNSRGLPAFSPILVVTLASQAILHRITTTVQLGQELWPYYSGRYFSSDH